MFKGKIEVFAQLLAFITTFSVLAYVSRTVFGLAFAFILSVLAMAITYFTLRGKPPSVYVKISLSSKICTYNLLAISYAVLLILLLSVHMLGLVPRSLIFFQEWGAIPTQNYILLLASIGVVFFLPGYFILRLIDVDCSIRNLDALVFSFLLSYLYTPFISLISLLSFGKVSAVFYLTASLLFLTICIFASRIFVNRNIYTKKEDIEVHLNLILLLNIIGFFIATLAFSKDYGYIAGFDVWRHLGTAISIIRYGLEVVRIPLNWFHIGLVSLFTLSGFPMVNSTLVLVMLNVMPILAFYCMAKGIFGEKTCVLPAVATVFFSLFSGFGWTYALYRMQVESWTNALARTASITANDTVFSNLWIWGHNPAWIGFIAFFMLFYLLFGTVTHKGVVFSLTLLTFLVGWALHVAEVYIFVILFGIILFCQSLKRSSKLSVCLALFVGLSTTLILVELSPGIAFFTIGFRESLLLLVYLIVTTVLMFASDRKMFVSFKKVITYVKYNRTMQISISMSILFLWLLSFYFWAQEEATLWNLRDISADIGFVPWYTYPMKLGMVGFFGLLALLLKDDIRSFLGRTSLHYATFLILVAALFVFGKIITITKIYYLSVDYWEIRILRYFLHGFVAIIAAMFVLYLFNFIKHRIRQIEIKKQGLSLKLLTAILLALVIVAGTMSTVFSVDYRANQPRRAVTKDLGIATLSLEESNPFKNQSVMFVSIMTDSADILDRLGVKQVYDPMRNTIVLAANPATYYFGIWFTKANYLLYVPEFDDYILESNRDSFIYTSVLQAFDPAYRINETLIYELPCGVPPTPGSEVLLIIPTGSPYTSVLNAFAQTNSSYDVALPNAFTNLYHPIIVLSYDPLDIELSQKLTKRLNEGATLIVFNVDKLGNFAEKLNLIRKNKIAPVEPTDSWKISIGEGHISTTTQNEQTIMNITGRTDINGWLRIDYILQEPWDLKDAEALAFKFKSDKPIQAILFALFDVNNNYQAYNLPCTFTEWKDFKLNLHTFTEASPSMNLSAISKIRIGINGEPNSAYDFYFSDIEIILKPNNMPSNSIAYKQQTLTLPSTINVPILNTNNATAFYILNDTKVSPLIIQKNYGTGRLIYVNAFPLVDNKGTSLKILPEILTWIQDTAELPSFNWTRDNINQRFEMYTKKIAAQGYINIDSNSIIFINGFELKLQAQDYSNIHFSIKATSMEITPSTTGTYTHVSVHGPFELNIFENEKLLSKYYITDNSTLLVKDPQITVRGETRLEKTFWRKEAVHWGRTLIFNGDITFTIHYPNVYLFIFDFKYKGSFQSFTLHSDLVKLYPQLEQAPTSLYLLIIFLVIIATLEKVRKSQKSKEKFPNQ